MGMIYFPSPEMNQHEQDSLYENGGNINDLVNISMNQEGLKSVTLFKRRIKFRHSFGDYVFLSIIVYWILALDSKDYTWSKYLSALMTSVHMSLHHEL